MARPCRVAQLLGERVDVRRAQPQLPGAPSRRGPPAALHECASLRANNPGFELRRMTWRAPAHYHNVVDGIRMFTEVIYCGLGICPFSLVNSSAEAQ